ncbi:phosphoribosylaminoimidazolesuccinocarboxamide synthase, partial [Neisseria sicca]|uniref:phosphoribosylaminoimidazolesuccinocarboxamide synthase n=1 Tax=Neisseria sicca TaxID=490 RepID=UPI0034D962F9
MMIWDRKFELGVDEKGRLRLMDEVVTQDSSGFWWGDEYQVGTNGASFEKQFV